MADERARGRERDGKEKGEKKSDPCDSSQSRSGMETLHKWQAVAPFTDDGTWADAREPTGEEVPWQVNYGRYGVFTCPFSCRQTDHSNIHT